MFSGLQVQGQQHTYFSGRQIIHEQCKNKLNHSKTTLKDARNKKMIISALMLKTENKNNIVLKRKK